MKKMLMVGLLAIGAIAMTQQQASAWIHSRFGIGMNWDYQSGGNSAVWGLWRNMQPGGHDPLGPHQLKYMPGAPAFVPSQLPAPVHVHQAPPPTVVVPPAQVVVPQTPPTTVVVPQAPKVVVPMPAPAPAVVPAPVAPMHLPFTGPTIAYPGMYQYGSPYQFATYPRPVYYYYYPTPYYYGQ